MSRSSRAGSLAASAGASCSRKWAHITAQSSPNVPPCSAVASESSSAAPEWAEISLEVMTPEQPRHRLARNRGGVMCHAFVRPRENCFPDPRRVPRELQHVHGGMEREPHRCPILRRLARQRSSLTGPHPRRRTRRPSSIPSAQDQRAAARAIARLGGEKSAQAHLRNSRIDAKRESGVAMYSAARRLKSFSPISSASAGSSTPVLR